MDVRVAETRDVEGSLTVEAFCRLREHPEFRGAVEGYAGANLAHYESLAPVERWLVSDLGRAAMSITMLILEGVYGYVSARLLIARTFENGICSRGRALAYLQCAERHGMITLDSNDPDNGRTYRLEPRFLAATLPFVQNPLRAAAQLAPEVRPAVKALLKAGFRQRFFTTLGLMMLSRPDLFADRRVPMMLFLGRDGGSRMLEKLLISQPPVRTHLLEQAAISSAALARTAFTSRPHVRRLLQDGKAKGFMAESGSGLVFAPELSSSAEHHFALVLEFVRAGAVTTLDVDQRPDA